MFNLLIDWKSKLLRLNNSEYALSNRNIFEMCMADFNHIRISILLFDHCKITEIAF